MEECIGNVIDKYGTPLEIHRDGQVLRIRGFLQSAQSKNWKKTEKEVSALGEIPGGLFVFIGRTGSAREGDTIRMGTDDFLLRKLDTIWYGDKGVYCWGLCSRKGGEDIWGA